MVATQETQEKVVYACKIGDDKLVHLRDSANGTIRPVCGREGKTIAADFDRYNLCEDCACWLADWSIDKETAYGLLLVYTKSKVNPSEWNWGTDDIVTSMMSWPHCQTPRLTQRETQLQETEIVRSVYVGASGQAKIHLWEGPLHYDEDTVCGRNGSPRPATFNWDDLCEDCYNWLERYSWVINDITDDVLELSHDMSARDVDLLPYSDVEDEDFLCRLPGRGSYPHGGHRPRAS